MTAAARGRAWEPVMSWAFAVGSVCFLVAPVPAYADAVGARADALTFFGGSLFFTTGGALQAWLAAIPAGAAVGLDTEFMRRHTFYPQLALLQLGWNGRHALIDPLAFDRFLAGHG